MSGSTSLARQLAALRTPGSSSVASTATYAGPFLFPEAGQLTSLAALKENVAESLSLLYSEDPGMSRYSLLLEMEPGEDEELVGDCLRRLSPLLLMRPAQFLLQWLVTKHKVHISQPAVFLFTALPHHTYKIYQAVVDCLEPATCKEPWLASFLRTCVPTNQRTLHRETATSTTFLKFLCNQVTALSSHLARQADSKVGRSATLVLTSLLGAIQQWGDVGEERLHALLAAILAGFKSGHEDLIGVSSILTAALLPKVRFTDKAVGRLLKAIGKVAKKSATEESLHLVLLIARTQGSREGLLELVCLHKSVIQAMVNQAQSEDGMLEALDGVAYSLAELAMSLVPERGEKVVASEQESLLLLLLSSTVSLPLSSESAERVARTVVAITSCLSKESEQVAELKTNVNKIVGKLESVHPEVYHAFLLNTDSASITFLPGVEAPTDEQVEVSRLINQNPVLIFFSSKALLKCTDEKAVSKTLRKHLSKLEKVLASPTSFLLTQMEKSKLELLLLNLLRVSGWGAQSLLAPTLRHLCSVDLASPLLLPQLELLLLPLLLTCEPTTAKEVLSSHLATTSPLLSLLSTLDPSSSMFSRALTQKLSLALQPAHYEAVISIPTLSSSPGLVTLLLRLAPLLVTRGDHNFSPVLTRLLTSTLQDVPIAWEVTSNNDEDNVALIQAAGKENQIPWSVLFQCISLLKDRSGETTVLGELIGVLPALYEKGRSEEAVKVGQVLKVSAGGAISYLSFLLEKSLEAPPKLAFVCLNEAVSQGGSLTDQHQQELASLLPMCIHHLLSPVGRLQKMAFKVLACFTNQGSLKPMVTFFQSHKSELVNNVENLETILKQEEGDKLSDTVCEHFLQLLLPLSPRIFTSTAPLFASLCTVKAAEYVAMLGKNFLGETSWNSLVVGEALATMVTQLPHIFLLQLGSKNVQEVFASLLSSMTIVEVAGVSKPVSHHLLHKLAQVECLTNLAPEHNALLLKLLLNNCLKSNPAAAAKVAALARPSPLAILEEMKQIWGESLTTGKLKGVVENEEAAWPSTCWLLEVLENHLGKNMEEDWTQLIKPVMALLRKVANMEVEEGTYKLSLLLNVLLKLLLCLSEVKLREVGKEVDAELVVSCLRNSPSPDTRQTALKILASTALAKPDFILHNSLTIFTFMGSHLLQVDSKRSFQVACEALEVLVPAMAAACKEGNRGSKLAGSCLGLLTTFVDSSRDIPNHRLTEFMVRLVRSLGVRDYLWVAALLLARKERKGERGAIEMLISFTPSEGVEALLRLMVNTRQDSIQLRKMFGVAGERRESEERPDDWDLVRLKALQLTATNLQDKGFKAHVGKVIQGEGEDEEAVDMLNLLIEATMKTIEQYTVSTVTMPARLKKNLVGHSEKTLEAALSILPCQRFLQLSSILLSSPTASVRLRALEVVSSKLSPPSSLPAECLPSLLPALVQLSLTEEHPHTQQVALLAVRQVAKLSTNPTLLIEPAKAFTPDFLKQVGNPKVLGAAVLSSGDLLCCLGARAVTLAPPLVAWLVENLEMPAREEWGEKEVVVVRNSFLYCLQKLVEGFSGFLSPLLPRLICLAARLVGEEGATSPRASALLSCLASSLPSHTILALAPMLLKTVWKEPPALPPLVAFIAEALRRLERPQLASVSKDFVAVFTAALAYRAEAGESADESVVTKVEEATITSFLSVALRLSLEDFKPLFQRLLAINQESEPHLVTVFQLTSRVAEKLKSLFNFGVENVVTAVVATLAVERKAALQGALLSALASLLSYNKVETLGLVQYESLVTSLLQDWLLTSPLLAPALSKLASATSDDTKWKFLHYQLLLGLRDPRSAVRAAILGVLKDSVTDRGDTYLPVLPDAVPFLQEILEDDDQAVEAECRSFIQHMETTFGQNIESYFV